MNLVARVKGILTNPRQEWAAIDAEPLNLSEVLVGYVLPLAAIGPIASVIGWSTFGFGGLFRMSIGSLITTAIISFILTIVGVFLCAWVANALAPSFGATPDMSQAIKVSIYSSTAAWVAGIFNIFPALAILAVIGGLYSLYLLFIGLPMLMKAPPDKGTTYTVVVIIVVIVVYMVVGTIATRARYF
jgi:Yip1 domain